MCNFTVSLRFTREWMGSLVLAVVLLHQPGCVVDKPPTVSGGGAAPVSVPRLLNSGCVREGTGCVCDAPLESIECHVRVGDQCRTGTMTCINGHWSMCEFDDGTSSRDVDVIGSVAALVSGPQACSSCNPACTRESAYPDDGDLTDDNSDDLEYSAALGGLVPTGGIVTPPPTIGCDTNRTLRFGEAATTVTYTVQTVWPSEKVRLAPVDDPTTTLDETGFVTEIRSTCPAACTGGSTAEGWCLDCPAAAEVVFEVDFENRIALPDTVDQTFHTAMKVDYYKWFLWIRTDALVACSYVPAAGGGGLCSDVGFGCSANEDCCSGVCAEDPRGGFNVCASTAAVCKGDGGACTVSADCCSGACDAGNCNSAAACTPLSTACTTDGECCSGSCSGGWCDSPAGCFATHEPCSRDSECCSGVCGADGTCDASSFCRVSGEPCSSDDQCCGTSCNADGICEDAIVACVPRYERCSRDSECCNFRCDPDPDTGVNRCMGFSGCRTSGPVPGRGTASSEGEICTTDEQCCSGRCDPDANGDLRCQRLSTNSGCAGGNPLMPDGEVCNNNCQCLSGSCDRYGSGAFGRRCGPGPICVADGDTCGADDGCCSGSCELHGDGAWRCGSPPGATTYGEGRFVLDMDSRDRCTLNVSAPDWATLVWQTSTPADSSIELEIQSAETVEALATTRPVSVTIPSKPDAGSTDIAALLMNAGINNGQRFLRVTAILRPSADGTIPPVLYGFDVEYTCRPRD